MKVLFDASAIGLSEMDLNARTGIFRYAESLAKGLKVLPDLELQFSSSEGFRPLSHLHDFLDKEKGWQGTPIVEPRLARQLFSSLYRFRPEHEVTDKWISKARRKVAWHAMKWVERSAKPLPASSLSKFDVFHSPYWPIPEVVRENPSIKRFLTIHDLYSLLKTPKAERAGHFEQSLLDSLGDNDFAFCVSEATKKDFLLLKPKFREDHVFVTGESLSDTIAPLSESEKMARLSSKGLVAGSYFLSVGAIHERKNIPHLIRSFFELVRKRKDKKLKLVVVGPPLAAYSKTLFQMEEIRSLGDQICFLGFAEDSLLSALYQGAIAFTYPSLYEGFGIPILEAYRCGCTVIASSSSSIPEVAANGALLVSPTSKAEWIQAMETVLEEKAIQSRLSPLAKVQLEKFTWANCVSATRKGYEAALASA